ncbi:hypothetical protein WR25_11136 [Diploscapter pachys]|uniref:Nematode cuticle collagen N-terminal domain-containing protein n=1 Tax=Diploscapter pachys TaxID=2018661 RepID=A0A2A2JJ83_9BILA|nr:hypothetical protein WR25_11136 [Diploscapter pachys]
MSAKVLVTVASGASGVVILACLVMVGVLFQDINNLYDEVMDEMIEFRMTANEAWKEMIVPQTPNLQTLFGRNKRQAPQCNCGPQSQNCPAGPPGPPGQQGEDGAPGEAGENGIPGGKGIGITADSGPGGCITCPMGSFEEIFSLKFKCFLFRTTWTVSLHFFFFILFRDTMPRDSDLDPTVQLENLAPTETMDKTEHLVKMALTVESEKQAMQELTAHPGPNGQDAERGQGMPGPAGEAGPQGSAGSDGQPGQDGGLIHILKSEIKSKSETFQNQERTAKLALLDPTVSQEALDPTGSSGAPGSDSAYCPCPARTAAVENNSNHGGYRKRVRKA